MQYKKKIFYSIMVFVFLFAIVNVKSFALPTENIEYDTLPDYTDEETYFGKLKKLSSDTLCEPKITYKSYWAPWQGEIKQDFPSKEYVLYQCDYYFDAPISVEETPRRLYPGEQIRHTDVFSYDSKETMKSISETSLSIFSEFSREKKIGFSIPVDILKLCGIQTDNFKIGAEWVSRELDEVSKEVHISLKREEPYEYTNNTGEYVFVQKNTRQRYYVLILCEYEYNYKVNESGSGAFGRDKNYSYEFKNYRCVSCESYLLPKDTPYLEYSIYLDKGDRIYYGAIDNVIFA